MDMVSINKHYHSNIGCDALLCRVRKDPRGISTKACWSLALSIRVLLHDEGRHEQGGQAIYFWRWYHLAHSSPVR